MFNKFFEVSGRGKKKEERGPTLEQKEKFREEINKFLQDQTHSQRLNFIPHWIKPGEVDFKKLQSSKNAEPGKYFANEETAFLDYELMGQPEIFDPYADQNYQNWLKKSPIFKTKINNHLSVFKYLHQELKNTHYLPGVEYQKYLFDQYKKDSQNFKNKFPTISNWGIYHFPGFAYYPTSDNGLQLLIGNFGYSDPKTDNKGYWGYFDVPLGDSDYPIDKGYEFFLLFKKPKELDEKGTE